MLKSLEIPHFIMTKLLKAYSYSVSVEMYCPGLISIFSALHGFVLLMHMAIYYQEFFLEESVLASKSLPAYVGDFPLVDR